MQNIKRKFYIFPFLVFVLLFVYSVLDFQTSRTTTGIVNIARGNVHIILLVLLIVLLTYYVYTSATAFLVKKKKGNIHYAIVVRSPVQASLMLIAGWVIINNIYQTEIGWISLIHIALSLLWVFVYYFFYNYLKRFPDSWGQIKISVMVMFYAYIIYMIYANITISNIYNKISVLNAIYPVLVFSPWISLLKNKRYVFICFTIVFLLVLVSMKRGALIAFPLMLIVLVYFKDVINKKGKRSLINISLLMILFIVSFIVVDNSVGGFLSHRFSSDELSSGSGRSDFYDIIIRDLLRRDNLEVIIGMGSGSSETILGTGVHNEWLEFLSTFGLIGVIIYLRLFISLANRLNKLIKIKSEYAPAYSMSIVYVLVVGMVGGIYFVHSTLYMIALFGVIEGLLVNDSKLAALNYK